jgi:8-oxo-(d)GTP phosphatase
MSRTAARSTRDGSADRRVVEAAGAVVWRLAGQGRAEVLLIHRPKYDDWSFPKGKLNADEPAPVAAVREVMEETGIKVRLGPPLPGVNYPLDNGLSKEVRYWSAGPRGGGDDPPFEPNHEVDRRGWFGLGEAARQLTHAHDRALLTGLSLTPTHTVVVLRHASATSRDGWSGDDVDRPLTEAGVGQAEKVATVLDAYAVSRVVSSNARRCVDTVLPYAVRHGLEVETDPSFAEGDDDVVIKAATRPLLDATEPTVVCTHRPTLPAVFETLGIPPVRLPLAGLTVVHLAVAHTTEHPRTAVAVEHLPPA